MDLNRILTLTGNDPDDAREHHGKIDWKPFEAQEISDQFDEYVPVSADAAEQPYSSIDQFLGAAKGQPGIAFGFRAGVGMPVVLLKYEDGQFFLGTQTVPDGFAGIDGNDGDADGDDLPILPAPGAGGAVRTEGAKDDVARIVEGLLKPAKRSSKALSEAEINRIALALLES